MFNREEKKHRPSFTTRFDYFIKSKKTNMQIALFLFWFIAMLCLVWLPEDGVRAFITGGISTVFLILVIWTIEIWQ